jgi:hypothetical protein
MLDVIKLVSPVDGSVYAERPALDDTQVEKAVSLARTAQIDWANTPVADRVGYCLKALDALKAMNDEIVPELAWQMGRPVRYGGEFGGVDERTRYMAKIAEDALPTIFRPQTGFKRYLKHVPLGIVMVIAPWNYPFMTAINTIMPALMAGNVVILKHAAQTLLVGERLPRPSRWPVCPRDVFQNIVLDPCRHGKAARVRPDRPRQFHRLRRRRTGDREGGRRHLRNPGPGTRRQGPGLCPRRCRPRLCHRQPGRRRLLQCRPVLLRYRAHLCPRASTTGSSTASST